MGRIRIVSLLSLEETLLFGSNCAKILPPGSILALRGDLGAGKTSFVQGLAQGLGILEQIQSPTFTYLSLYEAAIPLRHFDLYRLKSPTDFFALGFDEYFDSQGICAIEWSERLGEKLPERAITLEFSYDGPGRKVAISSPLEEKLVTYLAKWD